MSQSIGIPLYSIKSCWDVLKEVVWSMPDGEASHKADEDAFRNFGWKYGISKYLSKCLCYD
jgi:hypothetical protein